MKKHVAYLAATGLIVAFASPAFAICPMDGHAGMEQSYASKYKHEDSKNAEEAMSTFDPKVLETEASRTITSEPSVEKIETVLPE